jgi:hypothetical protein
MEPIFFWNFLNNSIVDGNRKGSCRPPTADPQAGTHRAPSVATEQLLRVGRRLEAVEEGAGVNTPPTVLTSHVPAGRRDPRCGRAQLRQHSSRSASLFAPRRCCCHPPRVGGDRSTGLAFGEEEEPPAVDIIVRHPRPQQLYVHSGPGSSGQLNDADARKHQEQVARKRVALLQHNNTLNVRAIKSTVKFPEIEGAEKLGDQGWNN